MDEIAYLDNAATTRIASEVVTAMDPFYQTTYGNAASIHNIGHEARNAMEEGRRQVAMGLGADYNEVVFTSGGTESNNLAIKGVAFANRMEKDHIITTKVDHDCVLHSCKWLESQGFKTTYLDVDEYGFVDIEQLKGSLTSKTALVSVIHANNEIGTINDIKALSEICHDMGVPIHTDACQSFTKADLDVEKMGLDLVTVNAHKIHGPKGIGALYIRKGTKISAWQHGGGQERGMRSGTANVHGIVGFGEAVKISDNADIPKMESLRDRLIKDILDNNPKTWLNGHPKKRLCNNANVSFKHIEGEGMLMYLSQKGVMVSTGSACSSNSLDPSHVLKAIGLPPADIHGAIRFSLSRYTIKKEIDHAVASMNEVAERLRQMSPFY